MSATEDTIVDDALEVEPGDEVRFETTYHEWANPLIVADTTAVVEWDVPEGENWRTREIVLRTDRGTNYLVSFDSHDETRCYTLNGEKKHTHNGFLRRLERLDGPEEHVCPDCAASFDDGQKLSGHRNTPQTDCTPINGDGDADQEESEDDVDLPDGVTDGDVDELTSGGIEIGALADELGVHRNEARRIAHELGYYKRVREVWTDRGQIDPRAIGILVLLVGLLFMAAISIGVMFP